MFSKMFIDSLANFLHLTLSEKNITKVKIKNLINIFSKMWIGELRKSKKNAKKV